MLRSSFSRNVRVMNSIGVRGIFQGQEGGQTIGFGDASNSPQEKKIPRMNYVNKVTLIGNVGNDPRVKHFDDGRVWASFPLATSTVVPGRDGESFTKTEWHNISVKNDKLAQITEKIIKKGAQVYLEGQLESSEFVGKDGVERRAWSIVMRYKSDLIVLKWPRSNDDNYHQNSGERESKGSQPQYGEQGQVYD